MRKNTSSREEENDMAAEKPQYDRKKSLLLRQEDSSIVIGRLEEPQIVVDVDTTHAGRQVTSQRSGDVMQEPCGN